MGRRTDTRERIIEASLELMRQKGYSATAISDIVTGSGAPRGSVTFHFPGGKDEIAGEVITLMGRSVIDQLDRVAADAVSPGDVVVAQVAEIGRAFLDSGYVSGCPVVPITIDGAVQSELVHDACASFFADWMDALTTHITSRGMDPTRASRVAAMTVYSTEGALVVCRAEKSVRALDAVAEEMAHLCSIGATDRAGTST
ncbi:TetR/AcrR family transcriptional regulator [Rhodococcus koreensis]